jgi:nucleotide-binding universal stress UspA family protein
VAALQSGRISRDTRQVAGVGRYRRPAGGTGTFVPVTHSVVVVRGAWRPANRPPGPVVVGADGSPAARAAVTFAFEEAALRDVPLVAVCALADAVGRLGGSRQLEEDFEHLVACESKEHPEVSAVRQVLSGTPRAALLAASADAQMLVLGARGRGGLGNMSLGSVAQTLLQHASCPVGVVHQTTHVR